MRLCEQMGMESLGWPVVVDVQNVADYMVDRERSDGEDRNWDPASDFPYWLSPWPHVAYEWTDRRALPLDCRRAVLSHTISHEDGTHSTTIEVVLPDSLGRIIWYGMRFELPQQGTTPDLSHEICVESDDLGAELLQLNKQDAGDILCGASPALMAISFLHCRNVTIRDETPPQTRQQRRHGPPALTYKVLDIEPMTRVLRDEGDVEHNGLKKALHICRGHFAHYGPDARLFGKYEGTFWHPMHVRGAAKNGVAIKDYSISP